MTDYGLTLTGFVPKPQQVIIAEIQATLQTAFGQNLNFASRSVFSQILGIFSERETLMWQALEDIYRSRYPTGAEGTSVDDLLAINNMTRLGALATSTAATDTSGTPGLLLFGTPGTLVPAGSVIGVFGHETTQQFTTDAGYTIGSPVDAVQQIIFTGGVPTTGAFTLSIVDPAGNLLTSTSIPYSASAAAVQAVIQALYDPVNAYFPYTDISVSGSIGTQLTISFGATSPSAGNPASGDQAQALFTVPTSTLQDGSVVVNLNVVTTVAGQPAQVEAAATCTVTGPTFVAANQLTVILSPISGWASVTNPLDCLTGRDIEGDLAALERRAANLNENANGPVQAIAEKVALVKGVVRARGFQNTSLAANQTVAFTGTPSAGSFTLTLAGFGGFPVTTGAIPWNAAAAAQVVRFSAMPTSGSFTLALGTLVTNPTWGSTLIPYTATAAVIQAAIRALTPDAGATHPYAGVIVTGSFSAGFVFAFGIEDQRPLVADTTLLVGATATVVPSVQAYINEASGYGPARVNGSFGAGFEIEFFASVGGQAQTLALAANSLTGVSAITVAYGLSGKAFQIVVDDNNGEAQNVDVATVIFNSQPAGIESFGNVSTGIDDTVGNTYDIRFSRPTQVPIYVRVDLVTDLTSAKTPKFNPVSVLTIQQDIVTIGAAFAIGGTVIGFGSDGLIGAFNDVAGIVSYTLYFGTSANPSSNTNIELQKTQAAQFETFNVIVSYL